MGLAAAGGAAVALGARIRPAGAPPGASPGSAAAPDSLRNIHAPTRSPAPVVAPPSSPPIRPRGREDLVLMAGTEWEAEGTIHHSGLLGPRVMVLGGVHGNEPGGWLAAESVAGWEVRRGALIVLPRVNWRSAAAFERTLDGFGDLNRLYPGHPEGLPMARMAHEITRLVEEWRPHWVWDMHESWGFYAERGENSGTAYIGQTVTAADLEAGRVLDDLVARVNPTLPEREQFLPRMRLGGYFGGGGGGGPSLTPEERAAREAERTLPDGTRGTSSLGLGRLVPGVSPVLIEMGQMNQPESRRSELHQLLLRELLLDLRMV